LAYSANEIVDVTFRYKLSMNKDYLKKDNVKYSSWIKNELAIRRKQMRKLKPEDMQETIM